MASWQFALIIMCGYLILALAIGIMAGRGRGGSLDEFAVADRNLSLLVTWFLMGGAVFSAFSFLGAPGWAYSRGGGPAFYILVYTAFAILPWYIVGPKVGRIGRAFRLYSLVGFLQQRFPSKALGVLV